MLEAYDYAPAFNQMANEADSLRPIHHSSSAQIPDSWGVTLHREVTQKRENGGYFPIDHNPCAKPVVLEQEVE